MWRPGSYAPEKRGGAVSSSSTSSNNTIYNNRRLFYYALETSSVVVLLLGKSDRDQKSLYLQTIPQYLVQAGYTKPITHAIACVSDISNLPSLASAVNDSMRGNNNTLAAYVNPFSSTWNPNTSVIKYISHDLLLKEAAARDPLFLRYSVIIVHETKSLYTSVLLGILRKILKHRKDLKIVILNFDSMMMVQEKRYRLFFKSSSVNVLNLIKDDVGASSSSSEIIYYLNNPTSNYIQAACNTIIDLSRKQRGDSSLVILVLLPGVEEIRAVTNLVKENDSGTTLLALIPLYEKSFRYSHSHNDQQRNNNRRQAVEVYLTTCSNVPPITFTHVIDSVYERLLYYYNLESRVQVLATVPRKSRSFNTTTFRLCTQDDYESIKSVSENNYKEELPNAILLLLCLGISDVAHFPFYNADCITSTAVALTLEFLLSLEAIKILQEKVCATPLGFSMIQCLPCNNSLETARMILHCEDHNIQDDVLTIAAMLSLENGVFIKRCREEDVLEAKGKFANENGDHFTLLDIYDEFVMQGRNASSWASSNCLCVKSLFKARQLKMHLTRYAKRYRMSSSNTTSSSSTEDSIKKAIVAGYFGNVAKLDVDGCYRTVGGNNSLVRVHSSSIFYNIGNPPLYVVYNSIVMSDSLSSSLPTIKDLVVINPLWVKSYYEVKDISAKSSGDSGSLGLPKEKKEEKKRTIIFKKPVKKTSKLPIHIGKAKRGLRSQF